ncbi:MAG: sulfurtransferase TusA family protein [Candidatus Thorarchaeota archaeon]|nr:sulfurtransferase TusA family protein [Candidatus Thorarchaeota archaeon]
MEAYTILDTSGDVCPVPVIKVRRRLDKLEKGNVLEVIGTHEESRGDIIRTIKQLKMELIKVETDKDRKWHILIRKPGG